MLICNCRDNWGTRKGPSPVTQRKFIGVFVFVHPMYCDLQIGSRVDPFMIVEDVKSIFIISSFFHVHFMVLVLQKFRMSLNQVIGKDIITSAVNFRRFRTLFKVILLCLVIIHAF